MAPKLRYQFSAAFKLRAVKEAEEFGVKPAARNLGVSPSNIHRWRSKKDVIAKMRKKSKTLRKGALKFPELEHRLAIWVKSIRRQGYPISTVKLRMKAKEMANEDNLLNFTGGTGWVSRFMKRENLSVRSKTTVGQKLPVDWEIKVSEFQWFVKAAYDIFELNFEDIYNMDEVPLTFDAPPSRTVNCTGAKSVYIRTTGHEKTSFTVVLCCSANGQKLKPMVIFKRKTIPKEVITSGVVVRCNEKGWMNKEVMAEWLHEVYQKRPETECSRSLLILDSMKSHRQESLKTLAAQYFTTLAVIPGGLTKILQPLDLTINRAFKSEVRKCWEKWMMDGVHTWTKGGNARKATFSEVCNWVEVSWVGVRTSIISKAFESAQILPSEEAAVPSTSGLTLSTSGPAQSDATLAALSKSSISAPTTSGLVSTSASSLMAPSDLPTAAASSLKASSTSLKAPSRSLKAPSTSGLPTTSASSLKILSKSGFSAPSTSNLSVPSTSLSTPPTSALSAPSTSGLSMPSVSGLSAPTMSGLAKTNESETESESDCDLLDPSRALDVSLLNLFCSDTEDSEFEGFIDPRETIKEAFNSDSDDSEFEGFPIELVDNLPDCPEIRARFLTRL